MAQRVRRAMENKDDGLLSGVVEMDETYLGGKPRKSNERTTEYGKKDEDRNKRGKTPNHWYC